MGARVCKGNRKRCLLLDSFFYGELRVFCDLFLDSAFILMNSAGEYV